MKVTIPERTFERLLSATKHSVANGDPREELCHIKLTVTKNSITAFSCDGYRASKITFEAEADEDFVIWIKPFSFKASKSGMRIVKIESIDLYICISIQNEKYDECFYQFPKKNIVSKINVENLFAIERDQKFACNTKYFKDALNAVSAVTNDRLKTAIIKTVTDKPTETILIEATDETFDFKQIVLPVRFGN